MLVTTQELVRHLADPDWLIFDCRHDLMNPAYGREAYAKGHIPSAVFVSLDDDMAAPKTGRNGRHPLPDAATLARTFERLGVTPGKRIVCYDDAGHMYSVRTWWALQWLGHTRVALLDGGFPKWTAEGRGTDAQVPQPDRGQFTPHPQLGATADADAMLVLHRDPRYVVIDARTGERFRGEQEPIDPVAGHIPGAKNRWFKANLNDDGTFKPAATLRSEFAALLGATPPDRVINQCGSGVTGCHNIFAMELAGFPGSKLYPGSWSEWCSDPSRPVAKGS